MKTICPSCGYYSDTTSTIFGAVNPKEGDVTVCLSCGHIEMYDAQGKLYTPTPEQYLKVSEGMRDYVALIVERIKKRGLLVDPARN